MPQMLAAYFRWCAEAELPIRPAAEEEEHPAVEEIYELTVVDMFGEPAFHFSRTSAHYFYRHEQR
jgi:hypothetical protein